MAVCKEVQVKHAAQQQAVENKENRVGPTESVKYHHAGVGQQQRPKSAI